jgi:hypothetical protein
MYKNNLFAFGAKHLMRNKGSLKSFRHKSQKTATATGGALYNSNNLDNYLLSLVGQARRMSISSKPKKQTKSSKRYGGALRFMR